VGCLGGPQRTAMSRMLPPPPRVACMAFRGALSAPALIRHAVGVAAAAAAAVAEASSSSSAAVSTISSTTVTSTTSTINSSANVRDNTYSDPDPDNLALKLVVPLLAFGLFFAFACCAVYRPQDCVDLKADLQRECLCMLLFHKRRSLRTSSQEQISERHEAAVARRRQRELNELLGGAGFNAALDALGGDGVAGRNNGGNVNAEINAPPPHGVDAEAVVVVIAPDGDPSPPLPANGDAVALGLDHDDEYRRADRPELAPPLLLQPLLPTSHEPVVQDSDQDDLSDVPVRAETDGLLSSPTDGDASSDVRVAWGSPHHDVDDVAVGESSV